MVLTSGIGGGCLVIGIKSPEIPPFNADKSGGVMLNLIISMFRCFVGHHILSATCNSLPACVVEHTFLGRHMIIQLRSGDLWIRTPTGYQKTTYDPTHHCLTKIPPREVADRLHALGLGLDEIKYWHEQLNTGASDGEK